MRDRLIYEEFSAGGVSKVALAKKHGTSPGVVEYVVKRYAVLKAKAGDLTIFDGLSARAVSFLMMADCYTKDDLKAAILSGKLNDVPNAGKKTLAELYDWAGIATTTTGAPCKVCPNCGHALT